MTIPQLGRGSNVLQGNSLANYISKTPVKSVVLGDSELTVTQAIVQLKYNKNNYNVAINGDTLHIWNIKIKINDRKETARRQG